MLKRALGLLVYFGALTAGCGDDVPPPLPDPVIGSYVISVEANGKIDEGIPMSVSVGSDLNVLMSFSAGFSQIRGVLEGSTKLTIPRQVVRINHSTGPADGVGGGEGTFTAEGAVDFVVRFETAGFGPADGGGGLGGMGQVEYKVTGQKQ